MFKRICAVATVVATMAMGAGPATAQPVPSRNTTRAQPVAAGTATSDTATSDTALEQQLRSRAGGPVRVERHDATGRVRFVGPSAGHPVRADRPGLPPERAARSFLARFGTLFGVRDQARELRTVATTARGTTRTRGGSVVRFEQLHRGVPVFAGDLAVRLDGRGNVLSAAGELLPGLDVDVTPTVGADAARRTAVTAIAKQREIRQEQLAAAAPVLTIYDPALLDAPGPTGARPVWRTEVTTARGAAVPVRELVLIDASTGGIALHVDQIETARYRRVCNQANVRSDAYLCSTRSPVRVEGQAATGDADVDQAYDYAGDTYDFYLAEVGRDSIDGAGMGLDSTVRYCPTDTSYGCPYANAFWDGQQMTYGQGFTFDDVVAHELTHGVTEHESHLLYYYQSGAINESLSDVFGELVDLTNGAGNDDPSVRWVMGEEVPGGAIRNMADPTLFGDPDRMTSPSYSSGTGDSGGVHTNSGVNNKAAYLITDGGSFNGQTVTGLGVDKTAKIYYEVNASLLTSGSDYGDLYDALPQACTNLVGTAGITTTDCEQVRKAVDATEMNLQPVTGAAAPEAPVCEAGTPTDLFLDTLDPLVGSWSASTTSGSAWSIITGYAHSGTHALYAPDESFTSIKELDLLTALTIPSGVPVYLRFDHAYDVEPRYDGGVVEYSTDSGAHWADAGPLFTDNGYVQNLSSGNPLGVRPAFTGTSTGYRSARLDLSSLAGQTVLFRWLLGTDSSVGYNWWIVDDVHAYACTVTPTLTDPNLVVTRVGTPPVELLAGTAFTVTDLTANAGDLPLAGVSRTRFFLSADAVRDAGDTALVGDRWVPALDGGVADAGSTRVTLPRSIADGSYRLLVCADVDGAVTEADETDNCTAAPGLIAVSSSSLEQPLDGAPVPRPPRGR